MAVGNKDTVFDSRMAGDQCILVFYVIHGMHGKHRSWPVFVAEQ